MRKTTYTLFLLTLAFVGGRTAAAESTGDKPNIILVMSDDMGWGELGMMGNKLISTASSRFLK